MNLVRWRKKVESAHILCICAYVGFVSAQLFVILRSCPVMSMWHLWRNAWDVVALMCLAAYCCICTFVCLSLSCSSMSSLFPSPLLSLYVNSTLTGQHFVLLPLTFSLTLDQWIFAWLSFSLCLCICMCAATWRLLVSSPDQYWFVFHAAIATLLDSLGSMENNSSLSFNFLMLIVRTKMDRNLSVYFTCPFSSAHTLSYWSFDSEIFPPSLIVPPWYQYTELAYYLLNWYSSHLRGLT